MCLVGMVVGLGALVVVALGVVAAAVLSAMGPVAGVVRAVGR